MSRLTDIRQSYRYRDIFEGQLQHLGLVILLVVGAKALLVTPADAPRLLGLTSTSWAIVSIWAAVIHQVLVAFVFRTQLYLKLMTFLFGEQDFWAWRSIFLPFLFIRPVTVILTGWADNVPVTDWRMAEIIIGAALLVPAIWAIHSVIVHFTFTRAIGGDHFGDDVAELPLVRQGAFAYVDNAMYGLVFLGLWAIALLFGSWNALIVALFQHTYIWVHMYCTEAPDMARIYGPAPVAPDAPSD